MDRRSPRKQKRSLFQSRIRLVVVGIFVAQILYVGFLTRRLQIKSTVYEPIIQSNEPSEPEPPRQRLAQQEQQQQQQDNDSAKDPISQSENNTTPQSDAFLSRVREFGLLQHESEPVDDEEEEESEFVKDLKRLEADLLESAKALEGNLTTKTDGFWKPLPTPPDQPVTFDAPFLSLPILRDASDMVVLVPSHFGSFVKREAIRRTWKTQTNATATVLFVVAHSNASSVENKFLHLEQERYHDLLEIPLVETYSLLPEKMMQAYHWVLQRLPKTQWIAKADDDMFVHLSNLQVYLRKYNPRIPMLLGEIISHSLVSREGKWAERDYEPEYYPFWPKGSAGHVLSVEALNYFIENSSSLHRYQGEDVSIGIWLDEAYQSKKLSDLVYVHAPESFFSGGKFACIENEYPLMVGHELKLDDQAKCLEKAVVAATAAAPGGPFENAWRDVPTFFRRSIAHGFQSDYEYEMPWVEQEYQNKHGRRDDDEILKTPAPELHQHGVIAET